MTITAGRGQYDRGATRRERALQERARLVAAVRELLRLHSAATLTVSIVCEHAQVGRNTLYAHFSGVESLAAQVVRDGDVQLQEALSGSAAAARTPRARLTALCDAWARFAADSPQVMQLLLAQAAQGDGVGRALEHELLQVARQGYALGASGRPPNEDAIAAISGAFRAVGGRIASGRNALRSSELSHMLAQLVLSALR